MKFRIKQSHVEAVKVSDIVAQAKGDKALEPAWLLNAYNDGAVRIEDARIAVGENRGYNDDYLVNTPNDGPGALSIVSAEDFESIYVPADAPEAEAAGADGVPSPGEARRARHAEIGRALQAIGGRLQGTPDGNEGPTLVDFGAELIGGDATL